MALTLIQEFNLALDRDLTARCAAALFRVSSSVQAESTTLPYPSNTPLATPMSPTRVNKRQALAVAVRQNVNSFTDRFMHELANNPRIATAMSTGFGADGFTVAGATNTSVTDAQIVRECALSWDAQAGVLATE